MVEVLVLVALAYIGYQLRRLIRFIESRQPPALPKPKRFARLRARMAGRVFVPLTGVSIPGSVALLYSILFIAFWVIHELAMAAAPAH